MCITFLVHLRERETNLFLSGVVKQGKQNFTNRRKVGLAVMSNKLQVEFCYVGKGGKVSKRSQ